MREDSLVAKGQVEVLLLEKDVCVNDVNWCIYQIIFVTLVDKHMTNWLLIQLSLQYVSQKDFVKFAL